MYFNCSKSFSYPLGTIFDHSNEFGDLVYEKCKSLQYLRKNFNTVNNSAAPKGAPYNIWTIIDYEIFMYIVFFIFILITRCL